jgi:hypothetical protein
MRRTVKQTKGASRGSSGGGASGWYGADRPKFLVR